jgi:hypothetical protein
VWVQIPAPPRQPSLFPHMGVGSCIVLPGGLLDQGHCTEPTLRTSQHHEGQAACLVTDTQWQLLVIMVKEKRPHTTVPNCPQEGLKPVGSLQAPPMSFCPSVGWPVLGTGQQ